DWGNRVMSTINNVAKLAGVSRMTVSRVLNNSGYISQETRERVEKAIAEINYVPNALARSLRFKQTNIIALILTDITNPFFTSVARGVEDVAREQGFSVIFCNTDESEAEEIKYLNILLQKQIDGFLLVPACDSIKSIAVLQARAVPAVVVDRRVPHGPVDSVRSDSEQGAYQLIRHLLALGHTRIAVLSGSSTVSTAVDRVAGYTRALREAGVDIDQQQIFFDQFTQGDGYLMARQALAAKPQPTALFAANNFIAFGAVRAVREAGLRIPEHISIVAFDDLPQSMIWEPFLTVAAQLAYEIGQRATELLLSRLAGEGPAETQEIMLPTTLIIRKSSAPPPSLPEP
ncbi:MAG: LacI family transcriptional regulator, partial [Chloroflexota bacterium]|nr:LacI family transcriptional regulator [Chloroflexota bacterium]